jgi:phosphoenolpyruvate---glycerone phosphotransferase subunit DhaK
MGAGVLRLYGNYGGDVMNFDMAGDLVEFDDIECTTVLLADDVASAPPEEREKRRGVAGMVYAFKIAGAAAEEGHDLEAVTAVAQKAADACRSIGAALSPAPCRRRASPPSRSPTTRWKWAWASTASPASGAASCSTADQIAGEMMDRLLADMPLGQGDRVSVMVNSLGATPPEELYILYRTVKARIEGAGAAIVMPLVGRYATSMEMAGVSFTLCKLDAELEALLKAPCDCAFWRVG